MYSGFSDLFLQFSKKTEFVDVPDWNYNNEYNRDRDRGYEFSEDLYCPGYFTSSMKEGDQLTFSAGLNEISSRRLNNLFESEIKKRIPLHNFKDCLENAAGQFIFNSKEGKGVTAGFHWYGQSARDTFIALPGLTLSTNHPETCKGVLDTLLKGLKNGLFPDYGPGEKIVYKSADASLWFFHTLQQYAIHTGTLDRIWDEYGANMRSILESYRSGTKYNIHMEQNGLLYAGESGIAVTWMDATAEGKPVTPRTGMPVELNALWYNAIRFSIEAATLANDKKFISEWGSVPLQIEVSFKKTFWNKEKGYLADCINDAYIDWSLRPNQIIAVSLYYSPIDNEIKKSVVEIVKAKLLTSRGLKTLSPEDKQYKGSYAGNQTERDLIYHQGTICPWLLGHFVEAYLKTNNENALSFVKSLYENFAPSILEYGIGTIAEIYDGNKPHKARGAISQATSVAELLRIRTMISDNHNKKVKKERKAKALQVS
jgi:predicted glycogen debranching enzyme